MHYYLMSISLTYHNRNTNNDIIINDYKNNHNHNHNINNNVTNKLQRHYYHHYIFSLLSQHNHKIIDNISAIRGGYGFGIENKQLHIEDVSDSLLSPQMKMEKQKMLAVLELVNTEKSYINGISN